MMTLKGFSAYSRQKTARARTRHDAGPVDFLLKGKLFSAMQIRPRRTASALNRRRFNRRQFHRNSPRLSTDVATFVVIARAPAEVAEVVLDEDRERIAMVVPDQQISLAIGRRGQNVRLASQLTGWDIDILNRAMERYCYGFGIEGLEILESPRSQASDLDDFRYYLADCDLCDPGVATTARARDHGSVAVAPVTAALQPGLSKAKSQLHIHRPS